MAELVQTFRFRVDLTISPASGPTAARPPDLTAKSTTTAPGTAAPPGGPGVQGAGTPPLGGTGVGPAGPAKDTLGTGGFQECAGLDLEADVHEYLEGGRNDGVVRRVGRAKLVPLVLKRGILTATDGGYADTRFWDWMQTVLDGTLPLPRYNGSVQVFDPTLTRVVARWSFIRSLPMKVVGPNLNARTGEVAIEELHLAHEGLRLEQKP